jgi:metal transporter CNNM
MGSLPSKNGSPTPRKRNVARSGSITEINIDAGGVRKVILETNSSSDDPEADAKQNDTSHGHSEDGKGNNDAGAKAENVKKKRRRKRKGPAKDENAATPSGSQNRH